MDTIELLLFRHLLTLAFLYYPDAVVARPIASTSTALRKTSNHR